MKEIFTDTSKQINYEKVYNAISEKVKKYLQEYNIKALIIGVSGGLDSGINSAILEPICSELGIPLIGRYIHIESNKEDEKERALQIGKMFCHNFASIDLTKMYQSTLPIFEEETEGMFNTFKKELSYDDKIRYGNIKARYRMIYLYNLAQKYKGIVIDNDNMTEHLLGFWTINGDVGDITPLASLFKTEVFELAKYVASMYEKANEIDKANALWSVINAVPTDGLGITSSDVEQFGVKTYDEVDDILISYKNDFGYDDVLNTYLYPKYGKEVVDKVINRHKNSEFKRHHPHKIILSHDDV